MRWANDFAHDGAEHVKQTLSVHTVGAMYLAANTVGAMYLAGEDCVVQGDSVILIDTRHGAKAAVQSRGSDVSQRTRSGGGGGELRL